MKSTTITAILLSLSTLNIIGGESNMSLLNPNKITKDDILDAKNTILDNKDTLLDWGASIYAVSTYITPLRGGESPDGWGTGLGISLPLEWSAENQKTWDVEAQTRVYWNNDNDNNSWLAELGLAYRYSFKSEPSAIDLYGRIFLGYKGVPEPDLYAGVGFGVEIPVRENVNMIVEPSILFGFDSNHAIGISTGFSWEF